MSLPRLSCGAATKVLSVRPERIRRVSTATEGYIQISGSIDEAVFLGDIVQYTLATISGVRIVFEEHRASGNKILRLGSSLIVCFDVADALPLAN